MTMSGIAGLSTAVSKAQLGASIVTSTLDALNSGYGSSRSSMSQDMASTYNFSKDVLSAAYNPVGMVVNSFG
jgi:hypothetical protein